ncbi:hypothetical protein EDC94DRAFT_571959 [Helicostylum pulchrum]|nr:hypothetical protein EDC94DRAFT_571959 [Helicostylum pulchrum]
MEADHQLVIDHHAKSNDDTTEKMQKEIETVQLKWQEEQQKLILELQSEHELAVQSLQNQHQLAIDLLESKLTAAVDESTTLKLEAKERDAEKEKVTSYHNEMKSVREQTQATHEESLKNKEKELDHMTTQFNELKKEMQKNSDGAKVNAEELRTLKIAYEKMITAKDKEIKEVEERLEETMGSDMTRVKNETEEENRVQSIVSQHQKEIKVLQTQFQQLLDLKDKELEGFSYRLKTVTTSQQKDLERLSEDYRQKFSSIDLECQKKEESLKSKALEMRWMAAEFESSEAKLKDQGTKLQNLENDNNKLRQNVEQYKEENEQMLRLIHQLQSEMHHIR